MDRPLKERTIGAVVLVAFAVLVVPVFLDGPANDGATVTETVTLPGQNDQPRRQQTIVLERDRDEPVPVPTGDSGNSASSGAAGAAPDAAPVRPSPEPVPVAGDDAEPTVEKVTESPAAGAADAAPETASAPVESASGLWAVQLGSFSNRANAERLAAELRDAGYAAFLSRLDAASGELHRVRVGPQADRASAEKVAATLSGAGHKGQVVPHP